MIRRSAGGRGLLVAAAGLIALLGCGSEGSPDPDRVLVFGIDGGDWDRAVPLMRQGKLPALERVWKTGVRRTLTSLPPGPGGVERLSPTIWTTAATGMMPERHGVHHFVTEAEGGEWQPVTSNQRQTAALWNMVSARDLTVGVIGWLVTWPAEPVNGYVVSSYTPFIFKWSEEPAARPIKGTLVEGIKHQVYPDVLQAKLETLKVPPETIDDAELSARFTGAPLPATPAEDVAKSLDGMRWSWAADATYEQIYHQLAAAPPLGARPDLELAYFASVDVVSHRFWKYMEPTTHILGPVDPAEIAAYGRSVESAYSSVDGVLARTLAHETEPMRVIVLSDHGFRENREAEQLEETLSSGWHRPEGMLLASGPGFRRAALLPAGSVVDVAPTVLYALELPAAVDMDGRPALELFDPDLVERRGARTIPSWEEETQRFREEAPLASPIDEEILERLETIGYL